MTAQAQSALQGTAAAILAQSAAPKFESTLDSLLYYSDPADIQGTSTTPLPRWFFLPAVYDHYYEPSAKSPFTTDYSGIEAMRWIEDANAQADRIREYRRRLFINHLPVIDYNQAFLPEPPKQYTVTINPEDHTVDITEFTGEIPAAPTLEAPEVKKRHWIRDFNSSLQFSQAYISPNWYQGGTNNLTMLLNLYYNVKLNQAYHPNLLFESTFQYKLGVNSTPDDSIRKYTINQDALQINSTFGVKAARRWYYSVTAQFKTQLFNSYTSNTRTLRSAMLSPGELNVGLGMTYNRQNAKKTFTFDASISPLSYNMRICTNHLLNPADFGINNGRRVEHHFGSSAECKITWQMAYNVKYSSRLYAFTDYDRAYADWENTFFFDINRFLSSQLYVNLRYDSSTPRIADEPKWHKLQVKEIISIGFSYKFSSL